MKTIKVGSAELQVAVAETAAEREQGLMHIKGLPCNHGMLFKFSQEKILSFWMKNTSIPLSIAFIGENMQIVEIQDMEPLDEKPIKSTKVAKYALETNKGWFDRNNISVGDKVSLESREKKSVKIKIIKLPPEAYELSKKIEDTLAKMIGHVVDTMVTPGNNADTFNVDVSEINKEG